MSLADYELPKREKIILLVAICSFVAWQVWASLHRPDPHLVDGVYLNPCCPPLILRNGAIVQGKKVTPFELDIMKFGLTAYPSRPIQASPSTELGIAIWGHPEKPDEPPVLSFNDPDHPTSFSTVDRNRRELVFHRK